MLKFLKMWAPSLSGKQKHPSGLKSLVSFSMDETESGFMSAWFAAWLHIDIFYNLGILEKKNSFVENVT